MKKKAVAVWRKELVHINKTRDNHFRYFGKYFDFTLLSPTNKKIAKHVERDGTKIVKIKVPNNMLWPFVFYLKSFYYFLKNKQFELLISPIGEEPIGWLFSRLLFWRRIILIYDLWDVPGHNITKHSIYSPKKYLILAYHFILNRIIKKGEIIIAGVVPAGLNKLNIDPAKIISSHNGIQPEAFVNEIKNATEYDNLWGWTAKGHIKIIYAGYIHKTRGSNLLLKYATRIKEKSINAQIIMVGPSDKNTYDQIRNEIIEKKLDDIIKVHKEVSSLLMHQIVTNADIGICALDNIDKFKWSYPVKIYEYLKCGIAVLATNLPGISSIIIDKKNGILFEANNQKDFNINLDLLIKDSKLRNYLRKNSIISTKHFEHDDIMNDITKAIYGRLDEGN